GGRRVDGRILAAPRARARRRSRLAGGHANLRDGVSVVAGLDDEVGDGGVAVRQEDELRVAADVGALLLLDEGGGPRLAVEVGELQSLVRDVVVGDVRLVVRADGERGPEADVVAGRRTAAAKAAGVVVGHGFLFRRKAIDRLPSDFAARGIPGPDDQVAVDHAHVPVGLVVSRDPHRAVARDRGGGVGADDARLELDAVGIGGAVVDRLLRVRAPAARAAG